MLKTTIKTITMKWETQRRREDEGGGIP
jgi:hypothetical protein